jgi:hypothetical protein
MWERFSMCPGISQKYLQRLSCKLIYQNRFDLLRVLRNKFRKVRSGVYITWKAPVKFLPGFGPGRTTCANTYPHDRLRAARPSTSGRRPRSVRGVGLIHTKEDLRDTMLTSNNGSPIYVKDVATLTVGHQPRLGIVGQDYDEDIVQGIILMRRGGRRSRTTLSIHRCPTVQLVFSAITCRSRTSSWAIRRTRRRPRIS